MDSQIEKNLILLLVTMIEDYSRYGDTIGYTKKEMDNFIEKYDLFNLDYSPSDAIELYKHEYLTKSEFVEKIRELFDDIESNRSEHMDIIDYIDFLESNNLIDICIDKMKNSDIVEEDGTWYLYANGGWSYFEDYFKIDSDYRNDVVKLLLNGEGWEMFDYDCHNFNDFSYLDVNDDNLKYLKTIVQNMRDDFEIEQDEIDEIDDLGDVVSIAKEYDLDDLLTGLEMAYCRAQGYADESEAYDSVIDQILDHFGITTDELKWVKRSEKSKYDDTLKIKFKDGDAAKEAIILFYKIENEPYDNSDYLINFSSPYNGWHGDVDKYIDEEIQERVPDYVDEKYLP